MNSMKKANELTEAERQKLLQDLEKDPSEIQPDWSINFGCSVKDVPSS